MTPGKLRRVYPVLGGLIALLILGAILYAQTTSDAETSSTAAFRHSLPSNVQTDTLVDVTRGSSANQEQAFLQNSPQKAADVEGSGLSVFELNYSTKDTFDRFLFARTSTVPHAVKLAYTTHATAVFTADSRDVATDLFSRYVDYKVALSVIDLEVDLSNHNLREVSYKLDEREGIRRSYFTDNEYHYLFSREAQVDEAALARLGIAQENSLSREERKALIVDSIKSGNRAEREAFEPTLNMHRISEIKQMHSQLNDRYNAVAAEFGVDVAERFAQTWEKQAQWQSKVADYTTFRDNLAQQGLAPGAFEEALSEYRSAQFSTNEIKRLKVLTAQ